MEYLGMKLTKIQGRPWEQADDLWIFKNTLPSPVRHGAIDLALYSIFLDRHNLTEHRHREVPPYRFVMPRHLKVSTTTGVPAEFAEIMRGVTGPSRLLVRPDGCRVACMFPFAILLSKFKTLVAFWSHHACQMGVSYADSWVAGSVLLVISQCPIPLSEQHPEKLSILGVKM